MATYFLDPSPTLLSMLRLTDGQDKKINFFTLALTNSKLLNQKAYEKFDKFFTDEDRKDRIIFSYLAQENILISMYIDSEVFVKEELLKESKIIHVGKTLEKTFIGDLLRNEIVIDGNEFPYKLESKKAAIEMEKILRKYLALKNSFKKRMCG